MSEFKGTKGKWIIEYSNRDDSYDIYNESKNEFVCTTMNSSDIEKYNALLMSKAPEMLTMLKRLRMDYEMIIPYFPRRNEIGNEIEQLIKEATTL